MQNVLMQLQPGQPMLIPADKGTLVLGNLHQTCEDDHHGLHEAGVNHGRSCEEDGRLPHENLREDCVKNRRDENRQSDVGLTLYRGGLSCLDVQT